MSLNKKLESWVEAGLITDTQRDKVLNHEQGSGGARWKNGVTMAGFFSILLGVALVIAANWSHISASVKLGVHFALNGGAAYLIWLWRNDDTHQRHRDIAVFILFGLTLTLIALIGQVYHVQSDIEGALKLWFVLTTPLILITTENRYTLVAWSLLGFYVVFAILADIFKIVPNEFRFWFLQILQSVLPLGLVMQTHIPFLKKHLAPHSEIVAHLMMAYIVISTSVSTMLFYGLSRHALDYSLATWACVFLVCTPLSIILWWASRKFLVARNLPTSRPDIVLISSLFILGLTVPLQGIDGSWIAAGSFIIYWLGLGAAWQQQGWARGVSLAVAMVSLRLFAVFIELFGSQMMTGLGLVISGILLLALVRLARITDKALKARIEP